MQNYKYIRCWNTKGKFIGTLAIGSLEELEKWSRVYPRYEFVSESM